MVSSWLEELESGNWDAELLSLKLTGPDKQFNGDGFLSWSRERGVQLRLITDGGQELVRLIFGPHPAPGTLLSDQHYLRLQAETHDGWSLTIDRVSPDGYEARTHHEQAVWKLTDASINSGIKLTKKQEFDRLNVTEALLAPLPLRDWPRGSETSHENPHFGFRTRQADWLEVETHIGQVVAQRRSSDLARLRIRHSSDEHESAVAAVQLAFSFLNGRMANIVACESAEVGKTTRRFGLPKAKLTRNNFAPPLGGVRELASYCEPLLTVAIDFFSTADGNDIGNLLYACFDSIDNTFTNHALMVCATLESLCTKLTHHTPEKILPPQLAEDVLSLLGERGCDAAIINRLQGFIESMDRNSPDNILRRWAKSNLLNVTLADVQAWKSVRNSVAHGTLLMVDEEHDETQRLVTKMDRLRNLVNKLVLQMIGYNGYYFDYVTWQKESFPLSDPSQL